MPKGTVSILGLGAMGSAVAARLRETGHDTTVWNRTPAKARPHVEAGSAHAATVAEAAAASDLVVTVLLDHAAVREHLDPVADHLAGKTLVNLTTTTTPNEARSTAAGAAAHGIGYLDGAVMAVPAMIGDTARLLHSGDHHAFTTAEPALKALGTAEYQGADAGLAALKTVLPSKTRRSSRACTSCSPASSRPRPS
ncbi:NAD(P)-binding domain-containing protein [Glycomyces paridis]|nr:NAD(P)-binding domain-containing protein [Glycomyces paridis]